jgi:hypothetical protein
LGPGGRIELDFSSPANLASPAHRLRVRWISRRTKLLDKLIRERGVARYGLFSLTTEGKSLPDGSESASGYLIDADNRVFFFWLDWDEKQRHITFTEWKQVELEPDWEDREYLDARSAAGIGD